MVSGLWIMQVPCPSPFCLFMFKFLNYDPEQCDQCDRLKIPPPSTVPPKKTSFLIIGTCNCENNVFADVDRVKDFEIRIFDYMLCVLSRFSSV